MVRSLARLTTIILLFSPSLALADTTLSITKVVADVPGANAGHQYVEVTNSGADPIDLGAKTIRLVDHSGKHLIKSYGGASTILAPNDSVVIAQNPATFLSDNPSYSGQILKSSFSLTETGSVSIVQTDGTVLATKSYASVQAAKPATKKSSSSSRGAQMSSSKKSKTHITYTSHSYGKGITAPADAANADSAGASFGYALPVPPSVLAFVDALVSNGWFAVFLGLLAFSGFSLMVIQKQTEGAFL